MFRGDKQQRVSRGDLGFHPRDRLRWTLVEILVVEWQVADLEQVAGKVAREKPDESFGQFEVDRLLTNAPNDHGNLAGGHCFLLVCKGLGGTMRFLSAHNSH